MENGKECAFSYAPKYFGLTKREYFACHIATGLSVQAIAGSHNGIKEMEVDVPFYAVRLADALLAELENKKK